MTSPEEHSRRDVAPAPWSPWRTVVSLGLVSLAADMVYEAMRSVAGPFLGSLGASALTVGVVTGAGEAVALVLRLVTGPWADRTRRHWRLTVIGYALTALSVPLLALAPALGAAGVAFATCLILLERTGKAIRSPSKSALLARVAVQVGRGKGFAVHKALDQVGAFAGPLVLAGAVAATGAVWPGLALLAVPGAVSLLLLAQLRRRAPYLVNASAALEPTPELTTSPHRTASALRLGRDAVGASLPRAFHSFSAAAALTTFGLMTFGVISFWFVDSGLMPLAAVPLVYALAMAVAAVGALASGTLFDRWGGRVLIVVPLVTALVPPLVFGTGLATVLPGIAAWGLATGVQDSTVKAFVAELVAEHRRASAYGVFAAMQGLGALAGGAVAGALLQEHRSLLVVIVALAQVAALGLLTKALRGDRRTGEQGRP